MRFYEIDGKKLPSVTSLLPPPYLVQWSANCAVESIIEQVKTLEKIDFSIARTAWKDISNEAKGIGTEVHDILETALVENIHTNDLVYDDTKPEIINCVGAFEDFLDSCGEYRVIATEETIHTNRWAGTRDVVMEIRRDGTPKTYVIDFKTSKALYTDNRIQVTAYASIGNYIPALLRLDKVTGEYDFRFEGQRGWPKSKTKTYLNKFNAYVDLYYALKEA